MNHFGWKNFYFERWSPSSSTNPNSEKSWRGLFVEREIRSQCFRSRFSLDDLHGHTEAVRAVFILQSLKLIFTGGYYSLIQMRDLEDRYLVSASGPLGCTIRAIVAGDDILVVDGADAFVQCWRAIDGNPRGFNITGSVANPSNEFRLCGN